MTQSAALFGTHVMLTGFLAAVGVGVGAWAVVRLARARAHLRHMHDAELDDLALRAEAEAVLAARLERGEIDRDAYARALLQLEGLAAAPAAVPPAPIAGAGAQRESSS